MRHRLGIVRILGLVAVGIVLALLLVEGTLRAIPQYLPEDVRLSLDLFRLHLGIYNVVQTDSDLGETLKPNSDVLIEGHPEYRYHIKTYLNFPDAGFRGNVAARPLVGVALGDSFTLGTGVEAEEAWPEQLSQLAGKNFANLGVFGYAPPQYTRVLKRYGLPLRPKIILYAIFLDNDLNEAYEFVQWRLKGGPYRYSLRRSGFLIRHSRLYQLLLYPKRKRAVKSVRAAADQKTPILTLEKQPVQGLEVAWDAVQGAILSAQHLAREEKATLVLLLLPSNAQSLRPILRAGTVHQAQILAILDEYHRRVLQLCEQSRIRCLDLAPQFRGQVLAGKQLYFRIDGHWDAAGHRLAARTIYDYLVSQRLLDAGTQ